MTDRTSRGVVAREQRNLDTDRLFAYHEATKHSYWSIRTHPHFLDWANQPDPFRCFEGATLLPLERRPPAFETATFEVLGRVGQFDPTVPILDRLSVSRLLWHSMAISAWKQVRGTDFRYSLRVNPSSGNLHPTELHLALRGFAGLQDGLYHYFVREHALEQRSRGDWPTELGRLAHLAEAEDAPAFIVLTSIFWREAWKYRDRAYRYCCHDAGHAAAAVLLAAQALGLPGMLVGHFSDEAVSEALALEAADEAPFLLIPLGAVRGAKTRATLEKIPAGPPAGVPNRLSEEVVPYYLIQGMHESTLLFEPLPPCPTLPGTEEGKRDGIALPAIPPRDLPLGEVVRKRRSALDFLPDASMDISELGPLLRFATADFPADWRGNLTGQPGSSLISLFLYVHRVRELEPGVYRYHPASHHLALLAAGDQRRAARHLSLEQDLAGHACIVFSMIANLELAARIYGNRGYRYAHFEAGFIGQRLYLGAEALGFNSTGIGAFYDDDVHHYLGIAPKHGQVIYHFAIGRAVVDDRLILIPPEEWE